MSLSQAQLSFQITPIILTGGIASNISGSMLPFISLTNPDAFTPDLLGGNEYFALDDAFAIFQPVVGGTLAQQQIAQYPFANLSVAANAIIRDPLNVSLVMMTPMKQEAAWAVKLATMQSLKATIDAHNNAGGRYTVLTPAYTYTDMLMLSLTDVSMANSPLPQNAWRWDFTKPLVTAAQAQAAMNNLMNQVTAGVPSNAETTSTPTALGNEASSVNVAPGAGGTAPWVPSSADLSAFTPGSAIASFNGATGEYAGLGLGNIAAPSFVLGTS